MIEALRAYSWPGNVRELENVISRAAILSTAASFQLPEGWNKAPVTGMSSTPLKITPEPFSLRSESPQSVPTTLEQFERTRILEVLHQTNWRIEGPKGASVILGLHPNTLRSRLQKLGIRNPSKLRNSVVETTK
jgi:transcriptional regulator with GAF, ATPase, and Fis domain